MRPLDTSPEAYQIQLDIFRAMRPEQRLKISFELNQTCRTLAATGVRMRHPDYNEEEVKLAVIRLELGDELFVTVYPQSMNIVP